MKLELFSSVLRQDLVFFDTHRTGDILSRLTVDVQDFKSSLKLCISQGIRSIAQILGCSVSLFFISPEMTGGMLLVVPAVIWIGAILGSLLRNISASAQAQAGKATLVSDQAVGSIRTVRAFAMEEDEYEMFSREVKESCHLNERLGLGIGLFQAGTNIFLNGLILGTLYVGGRLMATNQLSAGDLMAFLVATQTIQRSLAQLSLLFGHVMKGMAAGGRIFWLINLEPQMPITGGKKIPFHSMLGDVKFNNVTFSYPTRPQQKILENFSLHLAPGSTVAVVGSSGNGKSTIAALLERFYDVDDGSITIDDIDIRELDPTWLRGKAIGFINQEPILFAGTIMDNIRYGKQDATDQEVMEVAKLANADDFIKKFPDGYNTVVGERGVTISGGQKQRIAIARALIKNPSILLLDEATSALDAESEKIVQDALDRLTRGRTVLVIAHRLSTVRNADLIVVLSNGEIVEMGTHESLTQKKGLYWSLFWQQQLHESPRGSA
ncbi:mitochondrial potassium channel ATP-binding subunit isoform X2 [Anabrus simplex]